MPCEDVIQVLNDSLAKELLHSNIPARLTYTGRAGAPPRHPDRVRLNRDGVRHLHPAPCSKGGGD